MDAGKTTVSERLLYFSEAIPGLGEVDEGLATMDYLEEEKKRGITIEAGIASYQWKGVRVTFVDTPGHVDFGVEVDFALQAVEGVILVLSGVSGIESQSLEAWEKIKANRNATLIFINKMDMAGSDYRKVMEQIQVMFRIKPVALTLPVYMESPAGGAPALDGVIDVLNQLALYRSVEHPRKLIKGDVPAFLAEDYALARKDLIDVASQFNDALAHAWLAGEELKNEDIVAGTQGRHGQGGLHAGLHGFRPQERGHPPAHERREPAAAPSRRPRVPGAMAAGLEGPPLRSASGGRGAMGFIIKIRHYQDIGKIFLAKIFDPAALSRLESARFFRVFAESLEAIKDIAEIRPGDVVAIQSPQQWRMGQVLLSDGKADTGPAAGILGKKYRPLLQSRIELVHAEDFAYVDQVLKQLADTEPSISITPDPATGGWLISTVGELQLDVFCKRLKKDHKCDVKIGAPSVRYLEKLKGPQTGLENVSVAHGGGSAHRDRRARRPRGREELRRVCDPGRARIQRGPGGRFRAFRGPGHVRIREYRGPDLQDHGDFGFQRRRAVRKSVLCPFRSWRNASPIALNCTCPAPNSKYLSLSCAWKSSFPTNFAVWCWRIWPGGGGLSGNWTPTGITR